MRGKHVKIELGEEDRIELEKFAKTGKRSVKLVNRAKIILELDESDARKPLTQAVIAEKVGVTRQAVNDAKKSFLTADSVSVFLQRKKRETPPVQPKITGEVEAHIIALACSSAPEGCARWNVRLLADKCVELNYIDSISFKSVQRVLKKHSLSLT
jgi:predicted XRE-type DNA-binding protein